MAILDLLKKEQKNSNILTFKKHPYVELDLESKIHYLNGLALVMNEDDNIHESEKEYLSILINTFNLAPEQFEDILEFAINPQQDMILEMFEHFNTDEMKYLFLLDCMMIAHSDGDFSKPETDLIKQYILMLNLNEDLFNEIKNISISIINKDADSLKELITASNSIKIDLIQHFIDFYKIDYEDKNNLRISTKFKKMSSGSEFVIVIDKNGKLKSIGDNRYGYLGIGNEEGIFEEFQNVIDLPKDAKCLSVSSSNYHSLALFDNNDIYAWGNNGSGQLGDKTNIKRLSPFKVIGLPNNIKAVKIIASNYSSFVLFENGVIYASGKITQSNIFVEYKLNFKIVDFEIMYDSQDNAIVFLDENNQIQVLKIYSYFADWAIFDNNNIFKPQGLPENIKIKQINAGDEYFHVLLENDELYALGANNDAQLGIDKRSEPIKFFTRVYGIDNIKKLNSNHCGSARYEYNYIRSSCFVLALVKDGIYGWGGNQQNQLGKYDNYDSTYYEEGIIFKEKIWSKKYFEKKPKKIEEFSSYIKGNEEFEIACCSSESYLCNFTTFKLYKLGGHSRNSEIVTIYDFSK